MNSTAATTALMSKQWKLWPYFRATISWHADWLRWNVMDDTHTVKEHFKGIRCLEATNTTTTMQRNTYIYQDARGTVSEGPWKFSNTRCTTTDTGIAPAFRPTTRILLGPDRSCIWCSERLVPHQVAGFEFFLGDGANLRSSVGLLYDEAGNMRHLALVREDVRDFDQLEHSWTCVGRDSFSRGFLRRGCLLSHEGGR